MVPATQAFGFFDLGEPRREPANAEAPRRRVVLIGEDYLAHHRVYLAKDTRTA